MSEWDWDDEAFGDQPNPDAGRPTGTPVKQEPTMLEHRLSPGRYVTVTPEMRAKVATGAGEPIGRGKFTHRVSPGRYLVTEGKGMGYNGLVVGEGAGAPGFALPGAMAPGAAPSPAPAAGGAASWQDPGSWGQLFAGLGQAGASVAQSVAAVEGQRAESARLREQARGEMSLLQQAMEQLRAQPEVAPLAPVAQPTGVGATTAIIVVGGLVVLLLGGGLIWAVSRGQG